MRKVSVCLLLCFVLLFTACNGKTETFENTVAEYADSNSKDSTQDNNEIKKPDATGKIDAQNTGDATVNTESQGDANLDQGDATSNSHAGIIVHEKDCSEYQFDQLSGGMAYRIYSEHYDQLVSDTDEKKQNAIAMDMFTASMEAGNVNMAYDVNPDTRPLDDFYVIMLYIYFGEDGNQLLGSYATNESAMEEASKRSAALASLGDYEAVLDKAYSSAPVIDTLQFAYDNYGQYLVFE